MQISLETVRALAHLLEETDLAELTLESTTPSAKAIDSASQDVSNQIDSPGVTQPDRSFRLSLQRAAAKRNRRVADHQAAAATIAAITDAGTQVVAGEIEIVSTAVGVFRAREPELQVGDEIKAGAVIGSVEALKVPTEIICSASGRIHALLVQEGQGVEYGQVLLTVEVSGSAVS